MSVQVERLKRQMSLPVIGAPMFIVSQPALVRALLTVASPIV